uniref:RNA helicase n=1 Tax=Poecilia mexicana TaxID=48701 RepID=A0A3B3X0Y7_9TELE
MGGKKKKSAAQAAPAAAAATSSGSTPAVGGTGAVEDQKKHAANSKTNKPAKETKSKGSDLVSIQAELEKKIIKLINDFRQENGDKGPISGRLTTKKLLDLYTALEKFNFKREHIEEAMKSSVLYGGDLHSALDWLCLNLKDDELPDGFSQQLQEESQKSRPKFQPPPQQKPAERNPKVSEKDEAASMKDWILRYAEQSSDDEEEEDEGDKRTRNPELDEKFDPNDRYLILTAQLYDAKEMAADAKTKGDKMGQRKAQDRIRVIQQEMKQLESHPMFNPAIKVVDVPQKEKKTLPVTDYKDDLSFSLFEQAEKDPPNEPKDIRNFDYTARSWTGKSPKQFLIDWVRKNLPKSPPPAFHKVSAGRYWRCKVRVQRADDALEVCPTILTEDSMQAQHLAATLALYNLVKGQSSLCGYQIRMENLSGDWTRLLYCTTGVLLRKLQQDRHLSSLTHIIVDEVHERSVQSDFLLTILKDVVMKRSDLHLILMSATVDCDKFSSYFNRCPVVSIPGRTFPVEVSCNSGLLHKESELKKCVNRSCAVIISIYFCLTGAKPSCSHFKMILLIKCVTIPDVVFVIDTGKTKENKYHESSQMSSLVETFVSKASALQRQGRAGRVRNGFCFRLYPKFRFDAFMDYSIPEILRVPLEELCLHIMKCQYGSPEDFLSQALDAPQPQSVSNAVNLLRKIGACQPDNHILTPLGHHLASLPVNVKIGKMLIYGAILGCLEPIATIAAAITEKSPFSTPMNRKEEANLAKAALATANSDHLTIYNAYMGWKSSQTEGLRAEMSYCRKHFLNRTALLTIEDVKHELMKMMEQAGFWSSRSKQRAAALSKQQICILNAALTAGLYDSVARVLCNPPVDGLERVACTVETPQGRAQVHPSSVNRNLQVHGWLLYQEKVKYTKIYLRDTTLVSPFPMLLFGGDIDIQHREKLMTLDGWIHFQAPVRIGVIFKHLRKLMDSLLERKLENPRMNLEGDATIQVILDLIKSEHAA